MIDKVEKQKKDKVRQIRLSEAEDKLLASLSMETGETMSDILRNALRMYANLHKSRLD